jgi:type IV pilus assembly protein PilP
LDRYVNEVKARKKSPIPPLPEVKQFETYSYDETKVRDPFVPTKRKVAQAADSGIRPDDTRKREILEQFPLDTLTMVGSIEQNGQRWALIKTQDGTLYRTAPGKYMGQDNGKITRVTETEVVLQEIVPDGLGGWVKRQATLTVSE